MRSIFRILFFSLILAALGLYAIERYELRQYWETEDGLAQLQRDVLTYLGMSDPEEDAKQEERAKLEKLQDRLAQAIAANDHETVLTTIRELWAENIALPTSLLFIEGNALVELGRLEEAQIILTAYLEQAGEAGEYADQAKAQLARIEPDILMNEINAALGLKDYENALAVIAQIKALDAETPPQIYFIEGSLRYARDEFEMAGDLLRIYLETGDKAYADQANTILETMASAGKYEQTAGLNTDLMSVRDRSSQEARAAEKRTKAEEQARLKAEEEARQAEERRKAKELERQKAEAEEAERAQIAAAKAAKEQAEWESVVVNWEFLDGCWQNMHLVRMGPDKNREVLCFREDSKFLVTYYYYSNIQVGYPPTVCTTAHIVEFRSAKKLLLRNRTGNCSNGRRSRWEEDKTAEFVSNTEFVDTETTSRWRGLAQIPVHEKVNYKRLQEDETEVAKWFPGAPKFRPPRN